jgi:uncharacterized membrane protein YhaH (DUF805 family)
MKKILLLLVLAGTLLAQTAGTSSIRSALGELVDASRTVLLVSIAVEAVLALVFLGGAALIYFRKLKGAGKKETLWLLTAVILALIGAMSLLGVVFGIVGYLAPPAILKTMTG